MGKGNKTFEEEFDDEDNQSEQNLDFELFQQGSVGGGQRLLDNNFERKDSLFPNLNKFTSVYAPLPIRREQSFQYLIDPTLTNSVSNNNFLQMRDQDIYQDNFDEFNEMTNSKENADLKKQQSTLFQDTNNGSDNLYYNNSNQIENDQQDDANNAWVDVDDVNEINNKNNNNDNDTNKNNNNNNKSNRNNLNNNRTSINSNSNLNRNDSINQNRMISSYGNVANDSEEDNDDEDRQGGKPEQFIEIDSSKNLQNSSKQLQEDMVEISEGNQDEQQNDQDNQEDEELDIFSDEGEQKKSSSSIKCVDLETMEEEKRNKLIKPIRKNSQMIRDYTEIEEDQEVKETYKLTHAEEFGIVSNMNDWMNMSKNNMKLRFLNRKYQSELNRERNVQIKKSKNHKEIFERMKKKMKNLITSNQQLADSNQEVERRYKETIHQLQRVTNELIEKQTKFQELSCKLTKNETNLIELKTHLGNKHNEIQNLKNSISIHEQTAARIQEKKTLFETTIDSQFQLPSAERSVQIKEIQQKLDELNQLFGDKSLALSSSDDMFKIFCVMHNKMQNIQRDNQKKDEQISRLEKYQAEKNSLELRTRIAEEEFNAVKNNNSNLSKLLSDKENTIQHLNVQVRNAELISETNDRLQAEINSVQKQLLDKERLLMEQEVIHQIKIDNLLDNIQNIELKNSLKKQLEQLMDVNQIVSSQFNQQIPQNSSNPQNIIKKPKPSTTRVQIDKKKGEINEESILLKNTLMKLFNWEIEYVGDQPIRFNLVDRKNGEKKKLSVNLTLNADGEIIITNKQYLLKSVRKLWNMLNSDMHMTSLKSCVDNFWLITALQLKEYLSNEEQEFNKQMEQQSQNELTLQKDFAQEQDEQVVDQQNISYSDSLSPETEKSGQFEQENNQFSQGNEDRKNQDMEESLEESQNELQEEQEEEEERKDNEIDVENIEGNEDEEIEEDEDYEEDDEVIDNEDSNQNQNDQIQQNQQNWNAQYDRQDEEDDSKLLKELQQGISDKGEAEDEDIDDVSNNIQLEDNEQA